MNKFNIAIIGATGVVGRTLIDILDKKNFPINSLYLLASEKSSGTILRFNNKEYIVETLNNFNFNLVDIIFGCAGSEVTKSILPKLQNTKAILIDEASFLRKREDIPLIVPEINSHLINNYKINNIIASPNCCAVPIAILLNDLLKFLQIKRVFIATYQSYSGAGKAAVDNFVQETKNALESNNFNQIYNLQNLNSNIDSSNPNFNSNINSFDTNNITSDNLQKNNLNYNMHHNFINNNSQVNININLEHNANNFNLNKTSFNIIPKIGEINILNKTISNNNTFLNYTEEEEKIILEVQKLLNKNINISVTSVRVPVLIGHSFACNIEFEDEITDHILNNIKLYFNNETNHVKYNENILSPKEIMGTDFIYISRIRKSPFDAKVLDIWCMCDNLRKGAALNLAQIAENLIKLI
ncbi:MAG: Asd/ArgC dimerization domain-containing protein [Rickettsiales bacterium]